jgi:hypothetical protein
MQSHGRHRVPRRLDFGQLYDTGPDLHTFHQASCRWDERIIRRVRYVGILPGESM